MARTQSAAYDQRREGILDRAADLFAEKGFNGASVSDLARACKTSKSLIYHYCPSKEDILYGVMASHIDALIEIIEDVGTTGSATLRLGSLIERVIDLYVGAAARQKVLLNELDNLPSVRRAEIVSKQRTVISAFSRLVTEIQPVLKGDRSKATATTMLLFGMMNWTKNWFRPNGAIPPSQLSDLIIKFALTGIEGLSPTDTTQPKTRQKNSETQASVDRKKAPAVP